MIGETNAAIEGALAAGAEDILVNDSHGSMYNLLPAGSTRPRASSRARSRGRWSRARRARMRASTSRCSSAITPGPGHPRGTIAHTYSGAPVETRLDGRPTGEYGLNALALGAWGVPVGLVAGDDALAEEVEDWLPWAERVVVKTAVGGHARGVGPPDRRRAISSGPAPSGRSGARRPGSWSSSGSGRRSSSRSTTGAASRPTTRRSSREPSASATAGSASSSDDPLAGLPRVPRGEPPGRGDRTMTIAA